jgi:hypothetical protein
MSKSNSTEPSIVSHIVYRVPKKNHDAMLHFCEEAYDMFKQHGILHYDAFKLSNTIIKNWRATTKRLTKDRSLSTSTDGAKSTT